jgi:hypothetical protein
MKITEVSRSAFGFVAAIALNRSASAMFKPSIDSPPKRKKLRRETGPGQKLGVISGLIRFEEGQCFGRLMQFEC